jgi:hypothetical protein
MQAFVLVRHEAEQKMEASVYYIILSVAYLCSNALIDPQFGQQ